MSVENLLINEYVQKLLTDQQFLKKEYRKFVEQDYSIRNVAGTVSSDLLCKLIKKAKWNKKYRDMLVEILFYTDKNSINDSNFILLSKFSKLRRNTYFCSIAHAQTNLAFYQMATINRISGEYEAFAWLFDKICSSDMFTEEDMLHILRENKQITKYGIQSCIDQALEKYGKQRKIKVAEDFLSQSTKLDADVLT